LPNITIGKKITADKPGGQSKYGGREWGSKLYRWGKRRSKRSAWAERGKKKMGTKGGGLKNPWGRKRNPTPG